MPGVKRPRQSFTFEYKLKVVARGAEIGNRAAAREFELDESMIRYWKKKKDVMTKLPKRQYTHPPYAYIYMRIISIYLSGTVREKYTW